MPECHINISKEHKEWIKEELINLSALVKESIDKQPEYQRYKHDRR